MKCDLPRAIITMDTILFATRTENKTSSRKINLRSPIPPTILEIFSIVPRHTILIAVTKKVTTG